MHTMWLLRFSWLLSFCLGCYCTLTCLPCHFRLEWNATDGRSEILRETPEGLDYASKKWTGALVCSVFLRKIKVIPCPCPPSKFIPGSLMNQLGESGVSLSSQMNGPVSYSLLPQHASNHHWRPSPCLSLWLFTWTPADINWPIQDHRCPAHGQPPWQCPDLVHRPVL